MTARRKSGGFKVAAAAAAAAVALAPPVGASSAPEGGKGTGLAELRAFAARHPGGLRPEALPHLQLVPGLGRKEAAKLVREAVEYLGAREAVAAARGLRRSEEILRLAEAVDEACVREAMAAVEATDRLRKGGFADRYLGRPFHYVWNLGFHERQRVSDRFAERAAIREAVREVLASRGAATLSEAFGVLRKEASSGALAGWIRKWGSQPFDPVWRWTPWRSGERAYGELKRVVWGKEVREDRLPTLEEMEARVSAARMPELYLAAARGLRRNGLYEAARGLLEGYFLEGNLERVEGAAGGVSKEELAELRREVGELFEGERESIREEIRRGLIAEGSRRIREAAAGERERIRKEVKGSLAEGNLEARTREEIRVSAEEAVRARVARLGRDAAYGRLDRKGLQAAGAATVEQVREAFEIVDDMLDPAGRKGNVSDETWDGIGRGVVDALLTVIPAGRVSSVFARAAGEAAEMTAARLVVRAFGRGVGDGSMALARVGARTVASAAVNGVVFHHVAALLQSLPLGSAAWEHYWRGVLGAMVMMGSIEGGKLFFAGVVRNGWLAKRFAREGGALRPLERWNPHLKVGLPQPVRGLAWGADFLTEGAAFTVAGEFERLLAGELSPDTLPDTLLRDYAQALLTLTELKLAGGIARGAPAAERWAAHHVRGAARLPRSIFPAAVERGLQTLPDAARLRFAEELLGREISAEQGGALIAAHRLGAGRRTSAEILHWKYRLLRNAGFSGPESRSLIEWFVAGAPEGRGPGKEGKESGPTILAERRVKLEAGEVTVRVGSRESTSSKELRGAMDVAEEVIRKIDSAKESAPVQLIVSDQAGGKDFLFGAARLGAQLTYLSGEVVTVDRALKSVLRRFGLPEAPIRHRSDESQPVAEFKVRQVEQLSRLGPAVVVDTEIETLKRIRETSPGARLIWVDREAGGAFSPSLEGVRRVRELPALLVRAPVVVRYKAENTQGKAEEKEVRLRYTPELEEMLSGGTRPEEIVRQYLDPMTGLGSRRAFEERRKMDRRFEKPQIEIDLLDLKGANATAGGREVGDLYIAKFGEIMRRWLPDRELKDPEIFRGGRASDEFIVFLNGMSVPEARRLLELANQEFLHTRISYADRDGNRRHFVPSGFRAAFGVDQKDAASLTPELKKEGGAIVRASEAFRRRFDDQWDRGASPKWPASADEIPADAETGPAQAARPFLLVRNAGGEIRRIGIVSLPGDPARERYEYRNPKGGEIRVFKGRGELLRWLGEEGRFTPAAFLRREPPKSRPGPMRPPAGPARPKGTAGDLETSFHLPPRVTEAILALSEVPKEARLFPFLRGQGFEQKRETALFGRAIRDGDPVVLFVTHPTPGEPRFRFRLRKADGEVIDVNAEDVPALLADTRYRWLSRGRVSEKEGREILPVLLPGPEGTPAEAVGYVGQGGTADIFLLPNGRVRKVARNHGGKGYGDVAREGMILQLLNGLKPGRFVRVFTAPAGWEMEYLDGPTLYQLIDPKLPPEVRMRNAQKLKEGDLAGLYGDFRDLEREGLLFQDSVARNVIVADRGLVVLDPGLAQMRQEGAAARKLVELAGESAPAQSSWLANERWIKTEEAWQESRAATWDLYNTTVSWIVRAQGDAPSLAPFRDNRFPAGTFEAVNERLRKRGKSEESAGLRGRVYWSGLMRKMPGRTGETTWADEIFSRILGDSGGRKLARRSVEIRQVLVLLHALHDFRINGTPRDEWLRSELERVSEADPNLAMRRLMVALAAEIVRSGQTDKLVEEGAADFGGPLAQARPWLESETQRYRRSLSEDVARAPRGEFVRALEAYGAMGGQAASPETRRRSLDNWLDSSIAPRVAQRAKASGLAEAKIGEKVLELLLQPEVTFETAPVLQWALRESGRRDRPAHETAAENLVLLATHLAETGQVVEGDVTVRSFWGADTSNKKVSTLAEIHRLRPTRIWLRSSREGAPDLNLAARLLLEQAAYISANDDPAGVLFRRLPGRFLKEARRRNVPVDEMVALLARIQARWDGEAEAERRGQIAASMAKIESAVGLEVFLAQTVRAGRGDEFESLVHRPFDPGRWLAFMAGTEPKRKPPVLPRQRGLFDEEPAPPPAPPPPELLHWFGQLKNRIGRFIGPGPYRFLRFERLDEKGRKYPGRPAEAWFWGGDLTSRFSRMRGRGPSTRILWVAGLDRDLRAVQAGLAQLGKHRFELPGLEEPEVPGRSMEAVYLEVHVETRPAEVIVTRSKAPARAGGRTFPEFVYRAQSADGRLAKDEAIEALLAKLRAFKLVRDRNFSKALFAMVGREDQLGLSRVQREGETRWAFVLPAGPAADAASPAEPPGRP